jgi:2-polyprenyl-6-hydroxyphenyl methylase/3-demethylubiquinone-9 3-methyltransferase
MCRLGASVVGIDASKKNIEVAKFHAKKSGLKIDYRVASPEKLKTKVKFDVILNMEIVEHVENINFFINESSKLLKKNGVMFIATLNKTLKSYAFAILGAEYILKWLPIGTHDWEKFVKPNDLINISKKNNLTFKKLDGMKFNILDNSWEISNSTSVNYITKFVKN